MDELSPDIIYFTHSRISNKFTGCCKKLEETLNELIIGKISINDIPKIKVYFSNGKYFSENNRRLWVFKQLFILGKIKTINVRLIRTTDPKYIKNTYSLTAKLI